jgi:release factor glutamine methyltransferase
MRVVEQVAARLLRPGGTVVAEHADLQGSSAPAVFDGAGRWLDVADHRDLAGRDRYVTAVRRGATMAGTEEVGG